MATDKLINQTQGSQLISGLTAIASEIASINTNAVRPNSNTATENDIMVYGSNAYTAKDSGVSIETAQISGTLDTKLPTSKNIKTNVAGTAVLTNYPSTTPTSIQSVESTDTITQAIKKVEDNTRINNTNILLSEQMNGAKNICKLKSTIGNFSPVTVSVSSDKKITLNTTTATTSAVSQIITDAITVTPNQKYVISGCGGTGSVKLVVRDKVTSGSPWIAQQYGNALTFTPTTNSIDVIISVASSTTLTDFVISPMIITKAASDAGFTDYQPYAMSNAELTAAIQAIQAQLANT